MQRRVIARWRPLGECLEWVDDLTAAERARKVRVSPPLQATFAFLMLVSTPGGDAYTLGDLDEIARDAGFRGVRARQLAPTPQTLVVLAT